MINIKILDQEITFLPLYHQHEFRIDVFCRETNKHYALRHMADMKEFFYTKHFFNYLYTEITTKIYEDLYPHRVTKSA